MALFLVLDHFRVDDVLGLAVAARRPFAMAAARLPAACRAGVLVERLGRLLLRLGQRLERARDRLASFASSAFFTSLVADSIARRSDASSLSPDSFMNFSATYTD